MPAAEAHDVLDGTAGTSLAALRAWLPLAAPHLGPVLDLGVGSGLHAAVVLDALPGCRIWGLEPRPALRRLALSRICQHPDWFDRITIRPEDVFSAALPDRLGGALLLDAIGHFDAGERAAVLAELALRLPPGAAALLNLRPPRRPRRIEPYTVTVATIGELTYRTIVEARPVDTETMRWRTTHLSLDGERVLTEDVTEYLYRHPSPHRVTDEAARVGLTMHPFARPRFWALAPRT